MKKFTLVFVAIIVFVATGSAQNQLLTVGNHSNLMNETVLMFQNDNQIVIKFNLNQLELIDIETGYGNAFIPVSDKAPLMLQEGSPELFYLTSSFIIPDKGSSDLKISYGQYQDFVNIEIAPSKGNLPRSIDPRTVPFVKGEVYQTNGFFPGTLASLRDPFVMRDVRGQSLDVFPVQYNPVTKILRVYSEITITVDNTQTTGINEFTNQKRHKAIDPQFNQMYNNLFINSSVVQQRGYPTGEEGELLIICHPAFMDAMKDYVDWKRKIGRKTKMISTAETGMTYTSIKNYIQEYYNDPDHNLAYVLLVGDVAQVPVYSYNASGEICYSDIYYAQLQGIYLDVLIGRISAENVTHVQTQVQKSIMYERDLTSEDTWLSKAIGLAANQGGPGQGGHDGQEADYVHMNKIRDRLMNYGYNPVYQEYSNNCPGIPNTNTAQIASRFNEGMGVANYCNHGDVDGWYLAQGYSYIQFTNANVNALQNAGKLPYIFSVACLNGKFANTTCFAETWMRATQGGQPTGAVATFMASISISWNPPMTAQDEFNYICLDLNSPYSGTPSGVKRTIAGAMLNASQKMRLVHGANGNHDYNSWCVFGDPTLMFRTKTPEVMTVSYLPVVLGATEFSVECNVDGANATVSYRDDANEVVILGTAVVNDGTAEIAFTEPVVENMELTLAVTGFNKVTYLATLDLGETPDLHAPQNLTYTVEKANHVILEWEPPVEGKILEVKGYNIYRDDVMMNLELITDETTFTDIAPANGEYKYEVTAVYGATLESDPSEPAMVLIDGMCVPVDNNITTEEIEGKILVSWEAPEYEGTELAGYNVFRGEMPINTEMIPANELSFIDENVESETEYCYQVQVVYNDCDEILKTDMKCIMFVSVKENSGADMIKIFPNPTKNELRITNYELRIANIEIYDVYGKIVLSHTANRKPQIEINVSHLQSGIYFVKIITEHGSITRKLIVEN